LVTPLAVRIGYDAAAKLAYKAYNEGKSVRQVVLDEGVLSLEEAEEVLNPEKMC